MQVPDRRDDVPHAAIVPASDLPARCAFCEPVVTVGTVSQFWAALKANGANADLALALLSSLAYIPARVTSFASIPDIAHVEHLGPRGVRPALLIEVPHGADRRAHYDLWRARLVSDLPADLHAFFHLNTDVGAWQYGRRVAEKVAAARPELGIVLIRCLVPRTFIDTNRVPDAPDGLANGTGMTPAVAPYVDRAEDRALLGDAHRQYVELVARAYETICHAGGFALSPHTYGPRTLAISKIDHGIVGALRAAHEPDAIAAAPLRPELDLITRKADGTRVAPSGIVEELTAAYAALGITATESATYKMSEVTQSWRWQTRYPEQVLCLEVRRDLLVETWTPFDEQTVRADAADRFATPLADAILARLP